MCAPWLANDTSIYRVYVVDASRASKKCMQYSKSPIKDFFQKNFWLLRFHLELPGHWEGHLNHENKWDSSSNPTVGKKLNQNNMETPRRIDTHYTFKVFWSPLDRNVFGKVPSKVLCQNISNTDRTLWQCQKNPFIETIDESSLIFYSQQVNQLLLYNQSYQLRPQNIGVNVWNDFLHKRDVRKSLHR